MAQRVFIPRNYSFKKIQKQNHRLIGLSSRRYNLRVGVEVMLKVRRGGRVYPKQLETVRRSIRRLGKRTGNLNSYMVCDQPLTKKSSGIRMGKGKGATDDWVAPTTKGRIMFSLSNVGLFFGYYAMKKSQKKFQLPVVIRQNSVVFFRRFKNYFN